MRAVEPRATGRAGRGALPPAQRIGALPPARRVRATLGAGLVGAVLLVGLLPGAGTAAPGPDQPGPGATRPVFPSQEQVDDARAAAVARAGDVASIETELAADSRALDQAGVAAESATEAYNGAVWHRDQAAGAVAQARRDLAAAQAGADLQRSRLGNLAASAYRTGSGVDRLTEVATAQDPGQLLSTGGAVRAVAGDLDRAWAGYRAAAVRLAAEERRTEAALAAARTAEATARTAATAARAAQADQRSRVRSTAARRAELIGALARSRGVSVQLAAARQAGLEEQARQVAAEAARQESLRREAARKAAVAREVAARAAAARAAAAEQARVRAVAEQRERERAEQARDLADRLARARADQAREQAAQASAARDRAARQQAAQASAARDRAARQQAAEAAARERAAQARDRAEAREEQQRQDRADRDRTAEQRRADQRRADADRRAEEDRKAEKDRKADEPRKDEPRKDKRTKGGGGGGGSAPAARARGAAAAIAYARAQLGDPYVWGADGPDAFDCSGLVMRAWQAGGLALPHFSGGQYAATRRISLSDLRPGDLVFWSSDGRPDGIHHVAIYIGGEQIIAAPNSSTVVKVQSLYAPGSPDFFGRP